MVSLSPASVLIVDDDPAATSALQTTLKPLALRVAMATNGEEALEKLQRDHFRLMLTQRLLPGIDGLALARKAKALHPELRIAILAEPTTPEWEQKVRALGIERFSLGAAGTEKLREDLGRLLSQTPAHPSPAAGNIDPPVRPAAIVGVAEPIQELFRIIERARHSRAPVLIQGESGTGKELVARAIAQGGPSEGKMTVVNCCALSDNLIESELFGHARGAFSGALADREGLFETADGGTLFLDEIGDLPLRSQTKLLRILQEGEFRRVGENRLRHVQVRILAATNRNLREAVEHRHFREDLYYRLNVIPVYLPPLRERLSDVPHLALHFLHKHRHKNQAAMHFSESAVGRLARYPYPGNVRELENIVQRALSLARGSVITERDIEGCLQPLDRVVQTTPAFPGHTYPELKQHLRAWEKSFLEERLRAHGFQVSETAQALGIARTALHNRIKALGIHTEKALRDPASEPTPRIS